MGKTWAGVGREEGWRDDRISCYNAPAEGDLLLQLACGQRAQANLQSFYMT